MAINTLDGIIAGAQAPVFFAKNTTGTMVTGRPQSLWFVGGNPSAGTYPSTLAGTTLSSSSALVQGQIYFDDPVSGYSYLNRLAASITIPGTLVLCDRLWHNGGFTITSTAAQTINSTTLPARDLLGGTAGVGVQAALEISVAAGAAAPTITMVYTNSSGTGSRTSTNTFATANSPSIGAMFPLGLDAGDTGISQINTIQLSASWISGTMHMVLFRPIVALTLSGGNVPSAVDALTSGFPRLFDGTVPYMYFIPSTTTTSNVTGQFSVTQG